ncbi:DUF4262 domain-containing protein [Burkholderia sp. BCC0397]|uniref:DUF4262 domain-containing protein n=1 Tax=Burkholderia sp. BCC0397 TaxID=486876 RepID=UPI0015895439|nr:DUF4262 domain-containing protein [Burkholderia sp. BCC0397]
MTTRPDIATALDAPDSALEEDEQRFVHQIRQHGWFRTEVFAEGDAPGFSFTTGLWVNHGFPEIIVFSLPARIVHDVLWDVYRKVAAGTPPPIGEVTAAVYGNANALLMPVEPAHYEAHLGWNRWFYGNDAFPCVQLLWPDRNGVFPWQPEADDALNAAQPRLFASGDARH